MSSSTWQEHFKDKLVGLEKPRDGSFLEFALLEGRISDAEYLNWATDIFQLPVISSTFFSEKTPNPDLLKERTLPWSAICFPISRWDGVLTVACLEKPSTIPANVVLVLAAREAMAAWWEVIAPAGGSLDEAPEGISIGEGSEEKAGLERLLDESMTAATNLTSALNFTGITLVKIEPAAEPTEVAMANDHEIKAAEPKKLEQKPADSASEKTKTFTMLKVTTATPAAASAPALASAPVSVSAPAAKLNIPTETPVATTTPGLRPSSATLTATPQKAATIPDKTQAKATPAAAAPAAASVSVAASVSDSVSASDPAPGFDEISAVKHQPEGSEAIPAGKKSVNIVAATLTEKHVMTTLLANLPNFKNDLQSTFGRLAGCFDKMMFLFLGEQDSQLLPAYWSEEFGAAKVGGNVKLGQPSIFQIVFGTDKPFHGPIVSNDVNDLFFKTWNNDVRPEHITIVPFVYRNRTVGMLLGVGPQTSYTLPVLRFVEKAAAELARKNGGTGDSKAA